MDKASSNILHYSISKEGLGLKIERTINFRLAVSITPGPTWNNHLIQIFNFFPISPIDASYKRIIIFIFLGRSKDILPHTGKLFIELLDFPRGCLIFGLQLTFG